MKHKRKKSIFLDNGSRWKKVKKISLSSIIMLIGLIIGNIYVLFYSPFISIEELYQPDKIDTAIEEINMFSRPVIGKGTFVSVEDTYGTPYINRSGEDQKLVILTFDDGPDPAITPQVLKILKEKDVPATFFIVGSQMYKYPEIGHQILRQGSDLGIHTFSHTENKDDKELSTATFIKELDFTEKLFAYYYGYNTNIFRIPYMGLSDHPSYNSLQYIGEAQKRNMTISAPTVDAQDWNPNNSVQNVIELATTSDVQTVVILFHDAGGDRYTTLQALPEIIDFYKTRGYEFSTVSDYATMQGLISRTSLTLQEEIMSHITFHLYNFSQQGPSFVTKGFILGFIFVLIHTGVFLLLTLIYFVYKRRYLTKKYRKVKQYLRNRSPLVSIVIPMHNEEKTIIPTLRAVLNSSYKNLEVIIVDDGSTDRSVAVIRQKIFDKRIVILQQENLGKWKAQNWGLRYAHGKFVIFIDADTRVMPSAIRQILLPFYDKNVGAVAGTIHVGNRRNMLTKLQSVEYVVSQGIEKRVQTLFGSVMVVPGAFGAWKTSALRNVGGFTRQTHSEDFDATVALLSRGYRVHYSDSAIAYTETPLTLRQLYTQRFRWNFGNLQVYTKYKGLFFSNSTSTVSKVFFSRILLLQLPSVLLMPFVDLLIILNFLFGQWQITSVFFMLYIMLNIAISILAHRSTGRPARDSVYIPLQRICYVQIMYIVCYMTLLQALKGEIIAWSKINHIGRFSPAVR